MSALETRWTTWRGRLYMVLRLAGPEAILNLPDMGWDYDARPIGPGCLGWGKPPEEVEAMRERYVLVPEADLAKAAGDPEYLFDDVIVVDRTRARRVLNATQGSDITAPDLPSEPIAEDDRDSLLALAREAMA